MDSGIKATVRPLTPDNTVSLKDAFSRGAAGPIDRQDVSFDGKASPADSSQKVEQVIDQEQLQAAVAKVSSYVQSLSRSLDIRSDDRTGDTVIQVFDKSTDELIRQIPSLKAHGHNHRVGMLVVGVGYSHRLVSASRYMQPNSACPHCG